MASPENETRSYSGSAKPTNITADINDSATTIVLADASTWPDGSAGRIGAIIDAGKENEEFVWLGTKSGSSFINVIRGADETQKFSHANGATIAHAFAALDAREANAHVTNATASYVPHDQHVHKTVAQTISANHTFTGTVNHSGTEAFSGPINASVIVANSIDVDTIVGPTTLQGTVTYSDTPAAPKVITPTTTSSLGTSRAPMKSDAQLSVDIKAFYRVMHPAGEVMEWPYANLPQHIIGSDGQAAGEWKWADGSTVSATAYPAYAANAGTTHGGTASNPALPNRMNGRVPVGADNAHGLAATGGSYTKTLSVAEMPSHNHGVNDPGHQHPVNNDLGNRAMSTAASSNQYASPSGNQAISATIIQPAQTGITIQNNGGGAAFNIEQPWIGTKYICKVH